MDKGPGKILDEFSCNLGFHFSEALQKPLVKPYWIYISLSHKCNFNCRMCGVKNILKDQELSFESIKRILDEIASWRSECTVLFTGGEPFLRKDIFDIIAHAASLGIKAEVVNNGSMIDSPAMAKRIIESGLGNIAISLDGASAETHDYIRGRQGAYTKAINALGLLCREKKKNNKGPQISVWVTIMKENVFELYDVIGLTKNIGVDCLVYHPVVVRQEDMQNTIKGGQLWINEEQLGSLKAQLDKIVNYQKEYGFVAFLHDPYLWLEYFRGALKKEDWKCNPYVFVDIGPDGLLRSCGPAFGNVLESGIAGCLNTEAAKNARARMQRCQKACLQTCWAKPEADKLADIVNNFILQVDKLELKNGEKTGIMKKGLDLLSKYEDLTLPEP